MDGGMVGWNNSNDEVRMTNEISMTNDDGWDAWWEVAELNFVYMANYRGPCARFRK
jgi:hypothetical protein